MQHSNDRPYHKSPSALDVMRKRAAEDAAHNAAVQVVERWNAERSPLWSPTIRCAITAGRPWLEVYCPGCPTSRAIDIRTVDRHLLASVGSLVLGLRCCRHARPRAATRTADLEYLQVRAPPRMARHG
jgi:hypothetical protein